MLSRSERYSFSIFQEKYDSKCGFIGKRPRSLSTSLYSRTRVQVAAFTQYLYDVEEGVVAGQNRSQVGAEGTLRIA
jgi:hypothetical protein